jgi:hypothetical protein
LKHVNNFKLIPSEALLVKSNSSYCH